MNLNSFDIAEYNTPRNRRILLYAGLFVIFLAHCAVFAGVVQLLESSDLTIIGIWWTFTYWFIGADIDELTERMREAAAIGLIAMVFVVTVHTVYYPNLSSAAYTRTLPGMLFGSAFGLAFATIPALMVLRLGFAVDGYLNPESTVERRERILDEVLEDGDANE